MSQPFSDPASGDRLNPRDILGQLMIILPTEYVEGIATQYKNPRRADGLSDAIKVDVVTLDLINPETNTNIWRGALWFQNQLIVSLKPKIGALVLGRMGQGAAKPGQNPAFVINPASQDTTAVARAQAWLAQHPEFMNPNAQPQQPPQTQHQQFYGNGAPPPVSPQQQQTALDQLRRQAQQPFPTSGVPYQQNPGFQDQAPF